MQILLDNFIEAWINAIKYHDKIMDGYITLGIQKQFVSSLHNAVELCLKQIMLDKNNTAVAEIKIRNKEDARLSLEYFQAAETGSLNIFFKQLSSDKVSKFISIKFNDLKKKYNSFKLVDISDEKEKSEFTTSMGLLQNLRNDETHFYIDNSFLSEENFCKLHNFMILFYKSAVEDFLENNQLLRPWHVWGSNEIKMIDESGRNVIFNQTKLHKFSYKQAILDNELSNIIKECDKEMKLYGLHCSDIDTYALNIIDHFLQPQNSNYIHEDIHTMLLSMKNIKLIDIEEYEFKVKDLDDNTIDNYTCIYLNFNF